MHIDVAFTGIEVDRERALGRTAVVIDVLRATTTITALFGAGVREVWPVTDIDDAKILAADFRNRQVLSRETKSRSVLLAGERHGLPPEGFDMGNSPLQIDREKAQGATVVMTTTNGTRAINRALSADLVLAAAFVNAAAVIDFIIERNPDNLLLICAGTNDRFTLDDTLLSGLLTYRLQSRLPQVELTDSAAAAKSLYEYHAADVYHSIRHCTHGRNLAGIGLEDDIRYATTPDVLDVVPVLQVGDDGAKLVVYRLA